jgi:hypothetical protein
MVAKCANPKCSATFRFLKHGRLFLIAAEPSGNRLESDFLHHDRRKLQHFWLCDSCCKEFTLVQADGEIRVAPLHSVPRQHRHKRAS